MTTCPHRRLGCMQAEVESITLSWILFADHGLCFEILRHLWVGTFRSLGYNEIDV